MSSPKRSRQAGQRGQALILFVGITTAIFLAAAVVVDFGIWFSERQGAHKDADASSLAGAYELLGQDFVNIANNDFTAIQSNAEAAAYDWAQRNGVPPEDVHNLTVANTSCFGPSPVLDSVALDAEHHSRALFSGIFGLVAPQIGAHARVCLGSIISAEGLLPVGIQISGAQSDCDLAAEECCWGVDGAGEAYPRFGAECTLTFAGGDLTSGEGGSLRLYDDGGFSCSANNTGGGNTYTEEIADGGAETTCFVMPLDGTCDEFPNSCVYPFTGNRAVSEQRAIGELLAGEGECDGLPGVGDGDGTDEFLEVVEAVNGDPTPSPDTLFSKRDCDSPRLVSLIILEQFDPQGNAPAPILAFAGFFILGCENEAGDYNSDCDRQALGNPGKTILRGFFVNILETNGMVGAISKWSPKRIILKE